MSKFIVGVVSSIAIMVASSYYFCSKMQSAVEAAKSGSSPLVSNVKLDR